jgi:NADP-dependent 3-hydroxy acid dehydrogenase YdfG
MFFYVIEGRGMNSEINTVAMTKLYEQYGISPDRVANVVAFAIDQPEDTNVNKFTIGPTKRPW